VTRLLFIAGRLAQTLLVLWVVATLLFLIFRLMPGNPLVAYIDPNFTKEMQDALLRQFGLDKPLHIQYVVYLKNLVHGEFGRSFFTREPVSKAIWDVLPNTLMLTLSALVLKDFAMGLFKGAVFGVLVAWAGCLRGMQCGRSSAAVGLAATSAVVLGIVSIILSDAILTVIYNALGF